MPRPRDPSSPGSQAASGPRAVLRVPDVLMAVAAAPGGASLAELAPRLGVPKTSLHRLLRTLEHGGYLTSAGPVYRLGPASFQLAGLIRSAEPSTSFPACARPVLEELARTSEETVMLGILAGEAPDMFYADVIESAAPIRFTLAIGDRRPLYCAASGKAALAFMPLQTQADYLARTEFAVFTPTTSRKSDMPALLQAIARSGIAFDDGGKVAGASGIASPVFGRQGEVLGAVSVAGPSERIAAQRRRLEPLVKAAGEQISRLCGFGEAYPPPR